MGKKRKLGRSAVRSNGRTGKKRKRPEPPRFIVVARNGSIEVGVEPKGADSVLAFSIGPHPVNVGGLVPLGNVLDWERSGLNPWFNTEFEAAELDWLVPLLVRLHAGEDVSGEIKSAYQERHGRPPEMMR
jgi:hypothetical protein